MVSYWFARTGKTGIIIPKPINEKVFMEKFAEKYFTETSDKTRKAKYQSKYINGRK